MVTPPTAASYLWDMMKRLQRYDFGKAGLVSFGGICSALAALFQSAPLWIPAAGHALSPFATLPIAIIACFSSASGALGFFCTALILLFLSAHEALIFIFSTGLLGLALGLLHSKPFPVKGTASGAFLFCGMNILYWLFGINLFGPFTETVKGFIEIFFFAFSLLYAFIWAYIHELVQKRVLKNNPYGR